MWQVAASGQGHSQGRNQAAKREHWFDFAVRKRGFHKANKPIAPVWLKFILFSVTLRMLRELCACYARFSDNLRDSPTIFEISRQSSDFM